MGCELMENYRRLPLSGLCNARDLGGFFTLDGKLTKYHRFIRSEVPSSVTTEDIDFLIDYGITLSIDLRGEIEHEKLPNLIQQSGKFRSLKFSIFNTQVAKGAGIKQNEPFKNWGTMYVAMCNDSKPWVRDVITAISENDGGVIYNCTTGKDRTGIITAMLLGIARVPNDDIIADYCVSEVYLRQKYIDLFNKRPPMGPNFGNGAESSLDDPFFSTSHVNMRTLLESLENEYGGIIPYLKDAGLTEDVISAVRSKLID